MLPEKSSKVYKGSDCSRDTVAGLLADQGYEPVRQIAIDEDWSALRFRKAETSNDEAEICRNRER
ncbi:hypothetical protein PO124_02480 [Bacillus licheniformis]|nr:hypothetical protein [Bacillus licheniformis]